MADTKTQAVRAQAKAKQMAGRVRAAARRNEVLSLLVKGLSQRQVAEAVGVSVGQVNRDYRQALRDMVDAHVVEDVRVMTMERYDRLFSAWWDRAIGKDKEGEDGTALAPEAKAAGVILDILRHIRQLHGLDPKTQVPGDSPTNPLWTAPIDDKQREWISDLSDEDLRALDNELGPIFDKHRNGGGVEGGPPAP